MSMFREKTFEERYEEAGSYIVENGSDCRALVCVDVDVSGSVSGYINAIKTAVKNCIADLKSDDVTRGTAYLLLTFFGVGGAEGVKTIGPKSVSEIEDSEIDLVLADCGYGTPGETALRICREKRKALLKEWVAIPVDFMKPLEILITDMCFNSFTEGAFDRLIQDCNEDKISLIPIMTPQYNQEKANELKCAAKYLYSLEKQNEAGYSKLFQWIKASVKIVSHSAKGQEVDLPDPAQYGIKPLTISL